jgi:multidrug efflux pump subunit AcrA (membrane-fusion protein)
MPTRTRRRPVKPAPKPRPRRRSPGALTALLVVVAAGTVTAAVLSLKSSPATLVSERTVTVTKGVIQTVVSGSGNLAPAKQLDVDFATSGKLTKLYTKTGAHVSKGELLARIDNRAQKVDLAQAEAALADAQDALTKAQDAEAAGTSSTAAASAGAATTARAVAIAYHAQATPTPTTGADETPAGETTPAPSATPDGTGTATATATPEATVAPRGAAAPSATATVAPRGDAAPATAPSSGGGGGAASEGSTQSVESAQAAVDKAELALEDARNALDDTVLRAPMAGTVAAINGAVGDTAGSGSDTPEAGGGGSGFIVLAALSRLKLEVGLSESDIGKVVVGQSATITINAASGEKVAGHVTDVGVLASESTSGSSGAVSYPVTITLDQSADGIKAGMSATADIVVARASGLTVPSQALRGSTVTVERGGKRETVRVRTGVVGDSATQVLSGLKEGDKVIVTSTSAASGRTATGTGNERQTGGFGFGGAGGFRAGGGGFRAGGGGGFAGPPPGGPGG